MITGVPGTILREEHSRNCSRFIGWKAPCGSIWFGEVSRIRSIELVAATQASVFLLWVDSPSSATESKGGYQVPGLRMK